MPNRKIRQVTVTMTFLVDGDYRPADKSLIQTPQAFECLGEFDQIKADFDPILVEIKQEVKPYDKHRASALRDYLAGKIAKFKW